MSSSSAALPTAPPSERARLTGSALRDLAGGRSLLASAWALVNTDFCPQHNRWAYRLKHPVVGLAAAAGLSLFCGAVINPLAYVLGGTLLVLLVVGLVWPAIAVRATDVEVDWGRSRVAEGQTATVRVRVGNRLPIPLAGLVLTGLDGVADAKLPLIRPWGSRELSWTAQTKRRGVFPAKGPTEDGAAPTTGVWVATQMPFGVWTASEPVPVTGRLIVHPARTTLEGLADWGDPRGGEEWPTDRRAGTAGDLLGVRRFREGDSLRHVHWAQTARQRELIVCERQATISSTVRVGVDVPRDPAKLEVTMRAAASVAARLAAAGLAVELVLPDRVLRCDGSPVALLDGLAAVGQPDHDRSAPRPIAMRIGYGPDCRLRLDAPGFADGRDAAWDRIVAAAWKGACHAA